VNLIKSYFWLDLAAKTWSGSHQDEAVRSRDLVAQHLLPADLVADQQRAEKWLAEHQVSSSQK
jgi:hypothetical protein